MAPVKTTKEKYDDLTSLYKGQTPIPIYIDALAWNATGFSFVALQRLIMF